MRATLKKILFKKTNKTALDNACYRFSSEIRFYVDGRAFWVAGPNPALEFGGARKIFDPKEGFFVFCPSVPAREHEPKFTENSQKTGFARLGQGGGPSAPTSHLSTGPGVRLENPQNYPEKHCPA